MGLSKSDKLYLAFFATFIPMMACVDLIPLWPRAFVPAPLWALHTFYLETFNDQLMIKYPPWFAVFVFMEACYNLPTAIWIVFGIRRGDPRTWIHLCVFGTVCTITTWVCIVEMWRDADMSVLQKQMGMGCYLPFGIAFPIMAVHNMLRIQDRLVLAEKVESGKKGS